MDFLQIEGTQIPLLEAPQKYENPPRRILYVIFKHKQLIRAIFLLLSVPMCLYLLFRPAEYVASSKVLIKPSREFLNVSPISRDAGSTGLYLTPEIINTEIQIIKSPELAERLAKDVPFPGKATGQTPRVLTEAEINRDTEQRITILDDQLKQQKATISSNTNITVNPVYQQMQSKLTQLEIERDGLLQRYTAEDRLVKDKQKEIDELKRNLQAVKPTSVGSENIALNEVHRRILNELLGARVQLKALNEKKTALIQQVESYSASAADKKRKGFEYDRLLRDVNSKKENLDFYKKKAEEARISDAMDERKFSNAYILEKASVPLPRAGRGFMLLLMMTLIGAAGVAVAAAFCLEYFNRTLRNEGDIEEQLGLPVLATIQYYGDLRPVPVK